MIGERLFHVYDTVIATVGVVAGGALTAFLGVIRPYDPSDQMWQIVLPLMGSGIMAGGAILLNPATETRQIVIGRAAIAMFFGTFCPSLAITLATHMLPDGWQWIAENMGWPVPLIFMGGIVTPVIYAISRPFFRRMYERADAVAAEQIRRLEQLAQGPHNTVIVLDPTKLKTPPPPEPEKDVPSI